MLFLRLGGGYKGVGFQYDSHLCRFLYIGDLVQLRTSHSTMQGNNQHRQGWPGLRKALLAQLGLAPCPALPCRGCTAGGAAGTWDQERTAVPSPALATQRTSPGLQLHAMAREDGQGASHSAKGPAQRRRQRAQSWRPAGGLRLWPCGTRALQDRAEPAGPSRCGKPSQAGMGVPRWAGAGGRSPEILRAPPAAGVREEAVTRPSPLSRPHLWPPPSLALGSGPGSAGFGCFRRPPPPPHPRNPKHGGLARSGRI